MHTFRRVVKPGTNNATFQVGYFHPTTNNFIVLDVQNTATEAALAVNFLNGGSPEFWPVAFSDEVIL